MPPALMTVPENSEPCSSELVGASIDDDDLFVGYRTFSTTRLENLTL